MIYFLGTFGSFLLFCREHDVKPYDRRAVKFIMAERDLLGIHLKPTDDIIIGPTWGDLSPTDERMAIVDRVVKLVKERDREFNQ